MQGKRIQDVAFRMHVAQPKPRDRQGRPPVIPAGLEAARARKDAGEKKRSEKDVEVIDLSFPEACKRADDSAHTCALFDRHRKVHDRLQLLPGRWTPRIASPSASIQRRAQASIMPWPLSGHATS